MFSIDFNNQNKTPTQVVSLFNQSSFLRKVLKINFKRLYVLPSTVGFPLISHHESFIHRGTWTFESIPIQTVVFINKQKSKWYCTRKFKISDKAKWSKSLFVGGHLEIRAATHQKGQTNDRVRHPTSQPHKIKQLAQTKNKHTLAPHWRPYQV